jgi:hypothetical protein
MQHSLSSKQVDRKAPWLQLAASTGQPVGLVKGVLWWLQSYCGGLMLSGVYGGVIVKMWSCLTSVLQS